MIQGYVIRMRVGLLTGGKLDYPIGMLTPMKTRTAFITAFLMLSLVLGISIDAQSAEKQKAKTAAKKKPSPAMAPVEDVDGLPRVLLIGDSISIGYTVAVRTLMEGAANVHRPLTNCGPTTKGVEAIDEWLKTGGEGKKWDVIHFNWGLHDLKYMGSNGGGLADPEAAGSHQQVPIDDYRKNLALLVKTLKGTGSKLIWRNTTPVPEGCAGRVVGDSAKYNAVAAEVMAEAGVPVHDLYTFALERAAEIQLPANVHYSADGSKVLAEDVVRVIGKQLP